MLFNSAEFLVFFPVVTLLYFLLPHRFRWMLLLVASCIFYMAFIPAYIFILLITIVIDYSAAIFMERSEGRKRKFFLITSIVSTCLVLFIFKYFNFVNSNINFIAALFHSPVHIRHLNIILPVGLSFHTFQSLSYVIEVYYGRFRAEKHFGFYALYVMFYPQLVAGPIERPQQLLPQLRTSHAFDASEVTAGLRLMLWGFFKKLVIADNLAAMVNPVYDHYEQQNGLTLLLATYFFAFQIYCDFSGYSDIAIGAARVMGIRLMKNFDVPYRSLSVSEFWSRWHISLSTWFRDYLYIPLGGNRVKVPRWYFNILLTFIISGLWHGANWTFVVWGGLNGLYLVLEDFLRRKRRTTSSFNKVIATALTFHLILFSWIFFRASNLPAAMEIVHRIFYQVPGELVDYLNGQPVFKTIGEFSPFGIPAIVAMLIFFYMADNLKERLVALRLFHGSPAFRMAIYFLLFYAILFLGYFGETQFIYFQF